MALYTDTTSLSGTFDRSEKLKTPALFSVAARVKVPQLGAEDTQLSIQLPPKKPAQTSIVFRSFSQPEPVDKKYLKKISSDLQFGEDVVKDRCFHMLPYDQKYLYDVLSLDGIVQPPGKTKIPPGRHDARGSDVRHMPCNLTKSTKSNLKPLKRKIMERAKQMHEDALQKAAIDEEKRKSEVIPEEEDEEEEIKASFFLTEPQLPPPQPSSVRYKPPVPHWELGKPKEDIQSEEKSESTPSHTKVKPKSVTSKTKTLPIVEKKDNLDWDAYVLSKLDKNVATRLVHERTNDPDTKDRLAKLLANNYGKPDLNNFFLDESDAFDSHDLAKTEVETKPKKKWKKKEDS